METELEKSAHLFKTEFRKDLPFFSCCGLVVGLLTLSHHPSDESWPNRLFGEFIPMDAVGLIFFGYVILGCAATIIASSGFPQLWLENVVKHVEHRLTQLNTSTLSFLIGVSLVATGYWAKTQDKNALLVPVLSFLLCCLLNSTLVIGVIVKARMKPFNTWWGVSILMGIVGICMALLTIHRN